MKATVTKAFNGCKDGEAYPRMWQPGDEVEGDLARVAIAEKFASAHPSTPAAGQGKEKPAKTK